jgi:hypothetical protein
MCNYMRTFILKLVAFFIFSSCADNADLGDSYYYLDPLEAIDIGYPYGAIIYKSNKKLVFDTTIVSKEVVQVSHSDKFIFAKQLTDKNGLDTSYYIIDKGRDKVYGPTNLDSCQKLKIFLKTGL